MNVYDALRATFSETGPLPAVMVYQEIAVIRGF